VPDEAVQMYREYLEWRLGEGRPEALAKAYASVPPFVLTGTDAGHGPARDGTGVIFLESARFDFRLRPSPSYTLALCHLVDRAIPSEEDGQVTIVIDCREDASWPNPKPFDFMSFVREAAKTLPSKYPERLQRVVVYPVPWVATAFLAMVRKLLDPKTSEKLCVLGFGRDPSGIPVAELSKHVSLESLPRTCWHRHRALDPGRVERALKASPACSDDDDFFSASEDEDEPMAALPEPEPETFGSSLVAGAGGRSQSFLNWASKNRVGGKRSKSPTPEADEDPEKGVFVIGKEERELLLDILAEARRRPQSSWWCRLCPFRCRQCGNRRREL
jgi:hypothetical protein